MARTYHLIKWPLENIPVLRPIISSKSRQGCSGYVHWSRLVHFPLQRSLRGGSSNFYHSSSTAIYKRLDHTKHEIRVLHVHPGKDKDPISCELAVVSLDYRPRYDTLSYTWGDPQSTTLISVNGQPVPVTTNLFQALRAVRSRWQMATVWADALCIDQQNFSEKNKQVAMMGRIYKQGKQTWISLGSPDVEWANGKWSPAPKIEESYAMVKRRIRGLWRLFSQHILWRRSRKSRLGVGHVSDTLRLLNSLEAKENPDDQRQKDETMARSMLTWLIDHHYWTRVWIMQEVALSMYDPVCIFGKHHIPLLALHTILGNWRDGGLALLDDKSDIVGRTSWSSDMVTSLDRVYEICLLRDQLPVFRGAFGRGFYLDLVNCLRLTNRRGASRKHDYVYGLYSLLSPADQRRLPVNYDLSVHELYASVTKLILGKEKSAAILCAAVGMRGKNEHGLASWVLDLSQPVRFPAVQETARTYDFAPEDSSNRYDGLSMDGRYLGDYVVAVQTQDYLMFNERAKDLTLPSGWKGRSGADSSWLIASAGTCRSGLQGLQEQEAQSSAIACLFLNIAADSGPKLDLEAFFHILTANVYEEVKDLRLAGAYEEVSQKHSIAIRNVSRKIMLLKKIQLVEKIQLLKKTRLLKKIQLLKTYQTILPDLCEADLDEAESGAADLGEANLGEVDQDMTEVSSEFLKSLSLYLSAQAAGPARSFGQLFYTREGRIGKCLGEVQMYDQIWALPGSQTPFLLRPSESQKTQNTGAKRDTSYHLVGPCICSDMVVEHEDVSSHAVQHITIL